MNKDLEHLRLLSIFHYVVAGIIALFACFPLIHLVMGIMFLLMPMPPETRNMPNGEDPAIVFRTVGAMFVIIPAALIALGWALAVCVFIAGRKLAKHQGYTYCLIIAGVLCTFMPFGTVLGIFTIIVLLRDSVKQLFRGGTASNSFNPSGWR